MKEILKNTAKKWRNTLMENFIFFVQWKKQMIKENCDSRASSRLFLDANIKRSLETWVFKKLLLEMVKMESV